MDQQDNTRVIDRIRKLLALARDAAASEGERENALRMAYNTLAKYNIDMADVEASAQIGSNDPRIFHKFEGLTGDLWAMRVAQAVGKLFFCMYYKQGEQHVFVGRSVNVHTATYMAEYLIQSIEKQAKEGAKNHFAKARAIKVLLQQNIAEAATPRNWADSFKEGCALAISKRVTQMQKEAQEGAQGTGTALVVVSRYKNELALNEQFIKDAGISLSSARQQSKSISEQAAARGAAYGNSVSLNQQVGNSSSTLKLGHNK